MSEFDRMPSDEELLRRAVSYCSARQYRRRPGPRWVGVMNAFALGSTYSAALCRRFGIDPDEEVRG